MLLQFETIYEIYTEYLIFHLKVVDINYKDNFSKGSITAVKKNKKDCSFNAKYTCIMHHLFERYMFLKFSNCKVFLKMGEYKYF